jgi:hypothetical protein
MVSQLWGLFLLTSAQSLIISTATRSLESTSQFELDSVDLTGKHTKIVELDTVGGLLPNCGVLRNDNTVVFCSLCPAPFFADSCLTSVDAATGKVQFEQHYPILVIDNIGFDRLTNQTFVGAYNETSKTNFMFELKNETLHQVLKLPGIVQVAINAYSSSKHIFFLTVQVEEPDFGNNILAVSTVGQGKVLSNVWVDQGLEAMAYDDVAGILYAWGADSTYAGILMSLDYMTGKPIRKIYQSVTLSANGGTATLNPTGTLMFSSLLKYQEENKPVFHILNLSSGNATTIATNLYLLSMSFSQ